MNNAAFPMCEAWRNSPCHPYRMLETVASWHESDSRMLNDSSPTVNKAASRIFYAHSAVFNRSASKTSPFMLLFVFCQRMFIHFCLYFLSVLHFDSSVSPITENMPVVASPRFRTNLSPEYYVHQCETIKYFFTV